MLLMHWADKECARVERLRHRGRTGEPWPKRPKESARALDGSAKPHEILCGQKLQDYLVQNCAGDSVYCRPPIPQPATLADITN